LTIQLRILVVRGGIRRAARQLRRWVGAVQEYHANYVKWINQADAPTIFTHQFVERVLKSHWDPQSGQKAVILIFDGLRVDAWEELVRPVLEEKYDVLDQLTGSAILPSGTTLDPTLPNYLLACLPTGCRLFAGL
jgi:hypothetical protein